MKRQHPLKYITVAALAGLLAVLITSIPEQDSWSRGGTIAAVDDLQLVVERADEETLSADNDMTAATTLLRPDSDLTEGQEIHIQLKDDNSYRGTVTHTKQTRGGKTAGLSATIALEGHVYSRAYFSRSGDQSALVIRDESSREIHQLRGEVSASGFQYAPARRPEGSAPVACASCGEIHVAATDGAAIDTTTEAAGIAIAPSKQRRGFSGTELLAKTFATTSSGGAIPTDNITLRVLVVYTPAALAEAGSLAELQNRVAQAELVGNDVLSNSITYTQIEVAHLAEVAFTESAGHTIGDVENYLSQLTAVGDGVLDEVHALRTTHQADFVMLVLDTLRTSGIANRPVNFNSPEFAFSVVAVQEIDQKFTFIHEIAHNMGIGHSKTQPDFPFVAEAFFPYAAGWQWDDPDAVQTEGVLDGYCTVMTYESWNPSGLLNYWRVPHFSNPDISYEGNPTGNATEADAARVIRMGRFEFSGYRGAAQTTPAALSEFPASIDFEDYLSYFYQDPSGALDWGVQSGPTETPDTGPTGAQGGTYYFFVEASNAFSQTASLVIDLDLTEQNSATLEFSYHMRETGTTGQMGSLFVEASTNGGSNWQELWQRTGHQGDNWLQASVDLNAYAFGDVRLRVRAVTGTGNNSDIGLDSVSIINYLPQPTALVDAAVVPGSVIEISGTNLSGVTALSLAGQSTAFTVESDSLIRFVLPTTALSGQILLTNSSGSASAGNLGVLNYANRIAAEYPDLADPSPQVDPDLDGVSNFMEYAFGTALDVADRFSGAQIAINPSGTQLEVQFRRARLGVRYFVEATGSLNDWSVASVIWDSDLAPANLVPVGSVQILSLPVTLPEANFFRIGAAE